MSSSSKSPAKGAEDYFDRAKKNRDSTPGIGHNQPPSPLSDDLIEGAEGIAEEMFGDRKEKRKVYRLVSEVKPEDRLPVFRLGAIICIRRSTLFAWISERERQGTSGITSARGRS